MGTKLVAVTNVKFGGKVERTAAGIIRTEEATFVEAGKEFEADSTKTAEQLIESGAAVSPADWRAMKDAEKSAEERLAEYKAEMERETVAEKARGGDMGAATSNAHIEAQRREEEAVADAQKRAKGTKAATKTKDDDDK